MTTLTIEELPVEVVSALYVVAGYTAKCPQGELKVVLDGLHTDDEALGDYEFQVCRKSESSE